jgi:hypothetical protein
LEGSSPWWASLVGPPVLTCSHFRLVQVVVFENSKFIDVKSAGDGRYPEGLMSWMRRGVVGLLVVLLGAGVVAAVRTAAKTDAPVERPKAAEPDRNTIPADKAVGFMKGALGVEFSEAWTPSRDDVAELEERILAYLKRTEPRRSRVGWSDLPTYRRQYVGVMQKGRRVIWANFFCSTYRYEWTT